MSSTNNKEAMNNLRPPVTTDKETHKIPRKRQNNQETGRKEKEPK